MAYAMHSRLSLGLVDLRMLLIYGHHAHFVGNVSQHRLWFS